MPKIKLENGKEIEISKESYKALQESVKEDYIERDTSIMQYQLIGEIDWNTKEKVKNTIKKDRTIYVNQHFADNSTFGDYCIFINCESGSYCEFGSDCEFGSCCEFGSSCRFGSYCEFGSCCEFGSGCRFGSGCEFGSGCKKQTPYWDENGRHD